MAFEVTKEINGMETANSTKLLVPFYQITVRHITEECNLYVGFVHMFNNYAN